MSERIKRPKDNSFKQRCVELEAEVERLREVVMEYKRMAAQLVEKVVNLDFLRWRNAHTEPPTHEGRYIATCNNNFGSWSDNYWEKGRWEIEPVDYWRPIGPLPGGDK